MKKNTELILKTEKMVNQGVCLSRIDGKIVFVDNALPDELVKVRVTKIKKDYIEARVVEVLEKSPNRIEPICKFFGLCGGCKLQNLRYDEQLRIKKSFVEEAFERISKIGNVKINDVIPSDEIYFYRNKMEFSFAKRWLFESISYSEKEKDFALGLHIPKQFEKVIHIDECYLQSDFSNRVRNFISNFLFERGVSIHSLKNRSGLLKALLIRESMNVNEKMVGLVTTRYDEELLNELSSVLSKEFLEITTFVNIISSPDISSTLPEKIFTIFGKGYIYEKLLDYFFELYPNTFFQTNTKQAEKLFDFVQKYLEKKLSENNFSKFDALIDLYSGVGVIGILISKYFNRIFAFEDVKESVEAAKRNALLNDVTNISFSQKNLNEGFKVEEELDTKNLVVIADPPRSGMSEKTIQSILRLKPSLFIYISCNPTTQARDLAKFKELYKIEVLQPVDMFPQTFHIENIAILNLIS